MFNRYLAQTRRIEDLDALAALPFFLSMRAAIRAKVTAARLEQTEQSKHAAIARSATAYFEFAQRAIMPPAPAFIAVGGLSGTGKSVLARALAPHIAPMPGAVVLRSDVERKVMFGAGETDKLAAEAYTPEVTARVYATIADKARRTIAAGHSVIVDAVFARPQERKAMADAAKAVNATLRGLFLTADLETRIARVGTRAARRLRCRRESGACAGGLRPRRARLDRSRRLRHARADAQAGAPGTKFLPLKGEDGEQSEPGGGPSGSQHGPPPRSALRLDRSSPFRGGQDIISHVLRSPAPCRGHGRFLRLRQSVFAAGAAAAAFATNSASAWPKSPTS